MSGDIYDALRANADALAQELLPGGHYEDCRREWKCSAKNSPTGSAVSVHIGRGPKQGVCGFWNDFQRGGDIMDLIQMVHGLTKSNAVKWAKEWLSIPDDEYPMTRDNLKTRHRTATESKPSKISDEGRIFAAQRIWESADYVHGAGSAYLAARGISPIADTELRYSRGLPHPSGGIFPALVAKALNSAGEFTGVWRIFLKCDGSGKAPVETPRLGLGVFRGAAIRLGGVWPVIGIAEGVETALACRDIIRKSEKMVPVWSTMSTSGIRSFEPPNVVECVRIYPDADPVRFRQNGSVVIPSPGLEAARELQKKLCAKGITVVIEPPPIGMDWLDVLVKAKGFMEGVDAM